MNRLPEYAQVLIEKARGDLYALERLASDAGTPEWIVGFHAQQVAEKALKAVLSARSVEFPRTHNLGMLLDLLRDRGVSLPPDAQELPRLTPFGAALRYDMEPDRGAEQAIEPAWARDAARRTVAWAEDVLGGIPATQEIDMTPKEILEQTRRLINEHAASDPDKWWYANRYVFARLMLDERRTKAAIKQKLLGENAPCRICGNAFTSKRDVHLHRVNGDLGYSENNCVLMHADCHRKHHAEKGDDGSSNGHGRHPEAVKESKRYDDKAFLYWWDISPSLADSLKELEALEFVKKDTNERCAVPVQTLERFLIPERQTTRGKGNWGVKMLNDRPDELAFEPGTGGGKWLFLQVSWLTEADD